MKTHKPAKPPAAKPAAGIATIGALAALTKPAAKSGAKNYPKIPDADGAVAQLADFLAEETAQFKSLEASVTNLKAEVTALGRQAFYQSNHGKAEPMSSVEAVGTKSTILVSFQNRYPGSADPEEVTAIIGAEKAARYFRQTFSLKIDGDQIPADKAEDVIAAIAAVLEQFDCAGALSAKAAICPNSEYHASRHRFPIDTNLALDRLVPPVAVVRVK